MVARAWCEIPLTRGYVALVDVEDYEELSQFKWHAYPDGKTVYVRRSAPAPEGRRQVTELMHRRLIPGYPTIDHINHNGLDNRRANLRPATHAENRRNLSAPPISNKSGYLGVDWVNRFGKWRARIGDSIHVGLFDTPEEAAVARDKVVLEHHGEFAYLNFPDAVST